MYVFHAQHHFKAPTEDGLVETEPFLTASNEILVIIDYLGPSFLKSAFHRTRSDIDGNIQTVKNKYKMDPVKYRYLNLMLEDEKETQCSQATIALLWLKRALEYLYHFSLLLLKDEKSKTEADKQADKQEDYVSMSTIALEAYDLSLKRFHNYLLQGLFYLVAHVLPSKEDFLLLLAGGDSSKIHEALGELKEFTKGLKPNLEIVNNMYIQMGRNEEY